MKIKRKVLAMLCLMLVVGGGLFFVKYKKSNDNDTINYKKGVYTKRMYMNESLGFKFTVENDEGLGFVYPKGLIRVPGFINEDVFTDIFKKYELEAIYMFETGVSVIFFTTRVGKKESLSEYVENEYGYYNPEKDYEDKSVSKISMYPEKEDVDIQGIMFEGWKFKVYSCDEYGEGRLFLAKFGSNIFQIQIINFDGSSDDCYKNILSMFEKIGDKDNVASINEEAEKYEKILIDAVEEEKKDPTSECKEKCTEYIKGKIEGNIYINDYLKIKLELPKGATFMDFGDDEETFEEMVATSPDGKCNTYISVQYYLMDGYYKIIRNQLMEFKLSDGVGNEFFYRDKLDDYLGKKWYKYSLREIKDDGKRVRTSTGYIRKKEAVAFEIGFKYYDGCEDSMKQMMDAYSFIE